MTPVRELTFIFEEKKIVNFKVKKIEKSHIKHTRHRFTLSFYHSLIDKDLLIGE